MLNTKYQKYAYNFNPREGPKDIRLRLLMKMGVLRRYDIPIGQDTENSAYRSACGSVYRKYHECLEFNKFDRDICEKFQKQVISCEHDKKMYPKKQDLIARLTKGLENSKIRRDAYNRKLQQLYETKKYVKTPSTTKTQSNQAPKLDQKTELELTTLGEVDLQSLEQLQDTQAIAAELMQSATPVQANNENQQD